MSSGYDVIVIGGSPGGHCAGALAESGMQAALVGHKPTGGECSHQVGIEAAPASQNRSEKISAQVERDVSRAGARQHRWDA